MFGSVETRGASEDAPLMSTPKRDPVAEAIDSVGASLERVKKAAAERRKRLDEIRAALDDSRRLMGDAKTEPAEDTRPTAPAAPPGSGNGD